MKQEEEGGAAREAGDAVDRGLHVGAGDGEPAGAEHDRCVAAERDLERLRGAVERGQRDLLLLVAARGSAP
jgi:hypothetical protein